MTTLLLHPIGLDRTTWDDIPIAGAVAIDRPGHGGVPFGQVDSLADVADAIIASLIDMDGPIDAVGVSLGGMTALQLALRHPDRVRSIVVACAPAATPSEVMLQRSEDVVRLGMAGVKDATLERWFSPEVLAAGGDEVRAVERRLLADDSAIVAAYWRFIAAHDVRDRLAEIGMPVTVVAGTRDVSVPSVAARELAAGIPGARYVELSGAHMLHLEAPAAFTREVEEHLALIDG